jgi:hypothetical protein
VVPVAGPRAFRPHAALASAAWLGVAGVTLSATKAVTGLGLPCPWRALTGTLCPFCGGTTMGTHLLRGDLPAAWQANPFVLVLLVLGVLAVVAWTVEACGGPAIRPPARLRSAGLWWGVLGGVALAFAVWRNLA